MKNTKELTLKEIQEESFNVLVKLKEIFDANGWKYYLAYGTLLGAIRHKGFIPWDDDIDIWVPRDDYEKFIEFCKINKKELLPFELLHYSTKDNYIYPIARFSNKNYKIDYHNVEDYGLGLFVDIYPLDGINPLDIQYRKKIKSQTKKVFIMGNKTFIKDNNFIRNVIKKIRFNYLKNKNIVNELQKLDLMAQKYSIKDSEYINCVCWNFKEYNYKKINFIGKNEKQLIFNKVKFNVPYNYDEILKTTYGEYMKLPPKEEQIPHHYYSAYRK